MQNVQLSVDDEFVAMSNAVKALILDIKAGSSVLKDFEDLFANLVSSVQALQNTAVDIKKVDNQVYLMKCLGEALEPVPAPAP